MSEVVHPTFTSKDFLDCIEKKQIAKLDQIVVTVREAMQRGENQRLVHMETPLPSGAIKELFNYLKDNSNLVGFIFKLEEATPAGVMISWTIDENVEVLV